jgi:transcriptional regulator with XRE-family HTH domain
MEPTEEQFNALGNYRDIITQNASKVAEALGISPQTLIGWTEGNGEPTSEQAGKILEFLREKIKQDKICSACAPKRIIVLPLRSRSSTVRTNALVPVGPVTSPQ